MTFSKLRSQVDTLMRKYAKELAVHRLRPFANEYCDKWEETVAQGETPPEPIRLFKKLPRRDFLRRFFPAVHNYLDRCRLDRHLPHPNEILQFLVPRSAGLGLVPTPRRPVAY